MCPALADEAIRFARLVATLMPQHSEVLALLALELFRHSRAAARLDAAGDLVLLDDQDRSLWNADAIDEGLRMLAAAEHTLQHLGAPPGPYLLQAQIAAEHTTAPAAEATNFARIADLYARLSEVAPSPIVDLNRAIDDYPRLLYATRVDLLRCRGSHEDALPHYRRALKRAPFEPERRFLQRRQEGSRRW